MEEMKERLLGKTLEELRGAAVECGLKPFVGSQLADWLYAKRVTEWDRMNNISKAARQTLSERYDLGTSAPAGSALSSDGTRKYLFRVSCPVAGANEESAVEAVMIPDEERRTLCVSSQAGCKMGCRFCMTGRQGFHGNLSASDILNQFVSIDESAAPWGFAWSPKRITLSTIGVIPALKRYLDTQKCHLAVSLHNPFPDERLEMMPVQKAYPIDEVLELIRQYDFSGQRRVSFEYTMFSGFNDDKRHADALIRKLRGLECRVNLIRFHKIPDFPYETSPDRKMEEFRDRLSNNGIICTIRSSRGEDILAACGMLAGQHSQPR